MKIAIVDPDQLNFTYKIDGPNLPFRPIRAFDDGSHVYIQMPPEMKTQRRAGAADCSRRRHPDGQL